MIGGTKKFGLAKIKLNILKLFAPLTGTTHCFNYSNSWFWRQAEAIELSLIVTRGIRLKFLLKKKKNCEISLLFLFEVKFWKKKKIKNGLQWRPPLVENFLDFLKNLSEKSTWNLDFLKNNWCRFCVRQIFLALLPV